MAINNFDILKEMSRRNLDVRLAPLGNIDGMRYSDKKRATIVTIGVPGNVILQLTTDYFGGGLLLFNRSHFEEIKRELQEKEVAAPQEREK